MTQAYVDDLLSLTEDVPWWAISYLEPKTPLEHKLRDFMESGLTEKVRTRNALGTGADHRGTWTKMVARARKYAETHPLSALREQAWQQREQKGKEAGPVAKALRHAALRSERAFVQIINLTHDGEVWDLAEFQVHTIRAMRRNDVAAIYLPLEHGKLISHRTKVPTPDGWRLHGDLRIGDMVFGPDGIPTPVIAVHPDGEASLRVTFSDGESIEVHPKHEWRVFNRGSQRYEVRETGDIARLKFRSGNRSLLQVDYTQPVEMPEAKLPMDPYALGVWLGDGKSDDALVAHHGDDIHELPYPVRRRYVQSETGVHYTRYGTEMRTALREADVWRDKHIPDAYLWASRQQRWDLLCGLMDTDGSVDDRGRCRFVNTNLQLIEGVEHLLRTFGIRTRRLVAQPSLSTSGIQGKQVVYTVGFAPSVFPFRLERKLRKCVASPRKHTRRGIVSVEPMESVPGRCISVGREDGMYLVGETMIPTHNSAISSILVPLMDWAEWPDATEIRVYWNQSHVTKWISLLMGQVEHNAEMQKVFPWIRKPTFEDVAKHWSSEGFSIGGRSTNVRSFEVLTARGGSVGNRGARTGCDDWVNPQNAGSQSVQDGLMDYLLAGPMTFREYTKRESIYGTVWGATFYCGTFFDRRDVGVRFHDWCVAEGYAALKFDVYVKGAQAPDIVLWPRGRPAEYIAKMKRQLRKMFNKRMRNLIIDEGMETFSEDDVKAACQASLNAGDEYLFGRTPKGAHSLIGFDPAAGSKSRKAADPAIAVYSEVWHKDEVGKDTGEFTAHFVAFQRLHGYDFNKQCQTIVEWARQYRLPVVIEKNTLQSAYKSRIREMAPDIRVYDHQTGSEVWDPNDGVETFSPLFDSQHAVIHANGAPEDELNSLTQSLIDWPQPKEKDILMAFWFARSKMRKQVRTPREHDRVAGGLPDYLRPIAMYHSLVR